MKFIDEYRDKDLVLKLAEEIEKVSTKPVSLMEVCGGHTMSIQRFGLPALLPGTITAAFRPRLPCMRLKQKIS